MIMHSKPFLAIPNAVKYTWLAHLGQTTTGQVFSLDGVSILSIKSDYTAPKGKNQLTGDTGFCHNLHLQRQTRRFIHAP